MAARKTTGMSRQEAGRKGAEARWGKKSSSSRRTTATASRSSATRSLSTKRGASNRSSSRSPSRSSSISRSSLTISRGGRQEAGRKGGRTVAEKYGPEFYEEIGRRGGLARSSNRSSSLSRSSHSNKSGSSRLGSNKGGSSRSSVSRSGSSRSSANRGGSSRWGNLESSSRRSSEIGIRGGNRAQHQRAGRLGAETRWGRGFEEEGDFEEEGFSERGRGGRNAMMGSRWESGFEEDMENDEGFRGSSRGRSSRNRPGAAQRSQRGSANRSSEFYREIGRKGGRSRSR